MTDIETLRAAYDEQVRGVPPHPPAGVTHEQDGPLLRIVGQHRGFVTGPRDLGLRGTELDRLIARQRDYFAARGEAVEWKTRGHDLPADLPERLRAAGFVPEEQETVLIGRTAELAVPAAPPEGVTLRQVTADADMHRIAAMESAVWDQDWSWLADDLIGRVAATPDEITVLVAEAAPGAEPGAAEARTGSGPWAAPVLAPDAGPRGEVVCAAWLVHRPGTRFAGLWGGSTLPAWRGRGIYRSLVAARAGLAAARGVEYLQVDASDDSAPILRRLGFHAVTTTTPYVWSPKPA
jgi:hypothetical protein